MAYQLLPKLDAVASFVAVVESGGFSAAARVSGLRKATLSRNVQSLEQRLGLRLLVRTTRSVRLTDEGRAYFEHASRAIASMREAESSLLNASGEPTGLLRVTTTAALANLLVQEVVVAYLQRHPKVALELDVSSRAVDLSREAFDVALRVGPLPDSTLIARRLGSATGGYYAHPGYLARRGTPHSPEDLRGHDTLGVPSASGVTEWPFIVKGRVRSILVRPRLATGNLEIAVRAAAEGLGVVRVADYFAGPLVASGKLRQVLQAYTPPTVPVHALTPPGGLLAPKTRAFLDLVATFFRRSPGAPETGKAGPAAKRTRR